MYVVRVFTFGYVMLAAAIVINVIVAALGGTTWYRHITAMADQGFIQASLSLQVWEILFLFFIYPASLGIVIHAFRKRR